MSFQTNGNRFNDFDNNEKNQIYNTFKKSYEKSTGVSWEMNKFYSRASEWLFFGDINGFVTVRPQNSGFYKLTGIAGDIKSILNGINQLISSGHPIWGMATKEIGNVLIKRYGFRVPNKIESFVLSKMIPSSVFGNVKYAKNPDGTITFDYPDVGQATKMFIANDEYYSKIKKNTISNIFKKKSIKEDSIDEEIIDEKRAVEYTEDNFKILKDFIAKHGYENSYVSFRRTANTSFINVKNTFDTPTGYYAYPMKNFKDKIEEVTNVQDFFNIFPFTNNGIFAFLFVLRDDSNIIYSLNPDEAKMKKYVENIKRLYGNNPKVIKLCDSYLEGNVNSHISQDNRFNNEFQKFWLFLYEIASVVKHPNADTFNKEPATYTMIAYKIGLDGIVDDGCTSTIHSNEPCQAVFFYRFRNIIDNLKIIHIKDKYDKPVPIDRDYVDDNARNKYLEFLKKTLGTNEIYILDPNHLTKIKKNQPFAISISNIPFFIDKSGKKMNNIRLDAEISTDSQLLAAYFNSKLNTDYINVYQFGEFGDNVALAYRYVNGDNVPVFINNEGKPDLSGVELNKINDSVLRATYINTLAGTDYRRITSFNGDYGVDVAVAFIDDSSTGKSKTIFINKNGKPDTSSVDASRIDDDTLRAAFINQKFGTNYTEVQPFSKYGDGITMAYYKNSEGYDTEIFINNNGSPDTTNLDVSKVRNATLLARYINQKYGKDYKGIDSFDDYGNGVALAYLDTDNGVQTIFINKYGEPDMSNVELGKLVYDSTRATYFNQKYGYNYWTVERFGRYGNDVALAIIKVKDGDDKTIFINTEGKPDLTNVDVNKIEDSLGRAAYMNQKLGTNFKKVGTFGNYGEGIAMATYNKNGTSKGIFIDADGNSDISTIDFNLLEGQVLATYINQKYGTNYYVVDQFGEYAKGIALATVIDNSGFRNNVFINAKGKPSLVNINLSKLDSDSMRAAYFNQKYGSDYIAVGSFGKYGDGIFLAINKKYDNDLLSDAYTFINAKNEPDASTVDINKLIDSKLRATYFNQKYGKKFRSVGEFGWHGSDFSIADLMDGGRIFINYEGEPDTTNVNFDDLDSGRMRAIYLNTKLGTKYTSLQPFDGYGKDISVAEYQDKHGNIKRVFINRKGKPDTSNVDVSKIINNEVRAAYINQKYKKKYKIVEPYNKYGEGIALAYYFNDEYYMPIFINTEGKPTYGGVNLGLADDSTLSRAAYMNTQYDTNFYTVDKFDGDVAEASKYDNEGYNHYYQINSHGEIIKDYSINEVDGTIKQLIEDEVVKFLNEEKKQNIFEEIIHELTEIVKKY